MTMREGAGRAKTLHRCPPLYAVQGPQAARGDDAARLDDANYAQQETLVAVACRCCAAVRSHPASSRTLDVSGYSTHDRALSLRWQRVYQH